MYCHCNQGPQGQVGVCSLAVKGTRRGRVSPEELQIKRPEGESGDGTSWSETEKRVES